MARLYYFIFVLLFFACQNYRQQTDSFPAMTDAEQMITDSSWGPIDASTSFEQLKKIFPHQQIKDTTIFIEPYDQDSLIRVTEIWGDHRFAIFWKEGSYHQKIAFIRSYVGSYPYTSAAGKSVSSYPYKTSTGAGAGTTLQDLLVQNGKKISLHNFFGGKAGHIKSYNAGLLQDSPFFFSVFLADKSGITKAEYDTLLTSAELDTEMPLIKRLLTQIKIGEISLNLSKDDPRFKIPGREVKIIAPEK
jgi:hypothetical protein